ncbi:MAG: hypothetical protein [Caudoviricetes sp.]|nr:MAG: hypothetical protein [Caudoviricetes sp.]
MAVGLRVRNQGTGQIQIANGYTNLSLFRSGTLDTGTFSGGSTGGSPPFASKSPSGGLPYAPSQTDLHVVRYINDSVAYITGYSITQEKSRFGFKSTSIWASNNAPQKTLEYYTFRNVTNNPTGPVGLRMRDESGNIFYDSRKNGIRILQAVDLPQNNSGLPLELGQFFLGTKIGIAIPSPRTYYDSVSQDRCTMRVDAIHMTSDNRIFTSRIETNSQILLGNVFPAGSATTSPQSATIFIVDLTEVPLGFTA